ncbi:hypothetical protein CCACVL1_26140 [Corchorus capsularis]|uniref:Uncharacterized protein n=1 Tax=Corchorus capsularis TaxID=210143 RepID=A0A1R3GFT2_COCAP|nr:hypothetical protein CCACVL1_26140 [Corchorus capsularis]
MDSFDFDNVKAEKVKAMRRYNRLRSLATVFRCFELILALLFVAWTFERLPLTVEISVKFLLGIGGVIASPLFVFLVCNIIIFALVAQSGIFSAVHNADSHLYEEIIKTAESRSKKESQDEIVFRDKEIISEVNMRSRVCEQMEPELESETETDSDADVDNPRVYRRSKSENLVVKEKQSEETLKKELRRSETEKCRSTQHADDDKLFPEDDLSNEEFQRTIEDFIAKQLRFRREESLSIVPA